MDKNENEEFMRANGDADKCLNGQKPIPAVGCDSCAEEKLATLSDQLLRLRAEFDNYKKRTSREKEALAAESEARFMLRLLPIYEEIGLAKQEISKVKETAIRDGVSMVLSKLRTAFEKEGLSEMKLEGEKFDPFRHETAMREESDQPEGTIVRVIQKGYLFQGKILRHGIVSVSIGKKKQEKEETGDPKEEVGEGSE